MTFLSPLYLLLTGAIAVPLLIHLMRRRMGARVDFPAARYLARAEREHSRTLRIRNLLLMLLRVLAILAVALAAARPVARWVGAGHAPTAVALVVDNSMSTSVIENGRPLLDEFKVMAKALLAQATPSDRLWLVTIDGTVRGGSAAVLRDAIDRLQPIDGAGDPTLALSRAASIAQSAGLDARQVALLTDGQRSEWQNVPRLPGVQVLVFVPATKPPTNRAVIAADARPVRWTPSGAIAARFLSADSTTYRITLAGRTLSRGTAAPNEEVTIHAAPPERGWVDGTVELEPDELPADNVRHFAAWIGAAPGVTVAPSAGEFAANAVDVLRSAESVTNGNDIAVVTADDLGNLPALITAPTDPVRLGAANRALEKAGIAWRFGPKRAGATTVHGAGVDDVTVTMRYDLVAQAGAAAETLATAGRDAWIVAGPRFVLVGSPLTPDATDFPVRAAFVPWLGSVLTERLVGEPGQAIDTTPGVRLPRPRWADAMETADGERTPLGETLDAPSRAGTYFLTRGDHRVGALVVNAPPEESMLDRYSGDELRARLRAERTVSASSAAAWASLAFRAAARRPLVGPALALALILLVTEAVVIGARSRRAA